MLAKTLIDGNLNLPIFPYLDSDKNKVFRLLDTEFFEVLLDTDNQEDIIKEINTHLPTFSKQKNMFILCVYEN